MRLVTNLPLTKEMKALQRKYDLIDDLETIKRDPKVDIYSLNILYTSQSTAEIRCYIESELSKLRE